MKRVKLKPERIKVQLPKRQPDLIFCADLHFRLDKPVARVDDYYQAQFEKFNYILDLGRKYVCPILIAGDIGHRCWWSNRLLSDLMAVINQSGYNPGAGEVDDPYQKIYSVLGQHDMPQHNIELWRYGGVGVLSRGEFVLPVTVNEPLHIVPGIVLHCFNYGEKLKSHYEGKEKHFRNIALYHGMVIEDKPLWPGQKTPKAVSLLKKYNYDVIVCGDNHNSFAVKHDGKVLVNPGSMMRMTISQYDHKPSVYLWYADTNEVKRIYIPVDPIENVMDKRHIEDKKKRDDRFDELSTKLTSSYSAGLNFEENIKAILEKVPREVKKIILQAMEDTWQKTE